MKEEKEKTDIKKHPLENVEYGKSAFDRQLHPGAKKRIKKRFKLTKIGKTIIILIAIILIILIAYIGLNYFYSYELMSPGKTTFNPI